jgi:hypothetical protein
MRRGSDGASHHPEDIRDDMDVYFYIDTLICADHTYSKDYLEIMF